MLRLIQGEPCPRRRAEATRERQAVSDPNDLRFWLQRGFFEARDERAREGARSLLARAEAEHIEEEARKAARVAREGKEERLVQCRWQAQGEREVLVRLDTGELIDSRVAERQGKLFGGSDDKAVN